MNCPNCKNGEMEEEVTLGKWKDTAEIIFSCLHCGTVFHGILYRAEEKEEK